KGRGVRGEQARQIALDAPRVAAHEPATPQEPQHHQLDREHERERVDPERGAKVAPRQAGERARHAAGGTGEVGDAAERADGLSGAGREARRGEPREGRRQRGSGARPGGVAPHEAAPGGGAPEESAGPGAAGTAVTAAGGSANASYSGPYCDRNSGPRARKPASTGSRTTCPI